MADPEEDEDDFGSEPPRLLSSAVHSFDPEDSEIGMMHIDADFIHLSMLVNKSAATELRNALDLFIKGVAPFDLLEDELPKNK